MTPRPISAPRNRVAHWDTARSDSFARPHSIFVIFGGRVDGTVILDAERCGGGHPASAGNSVPKEATWPTSRTRWRSRRSTSFGFSSRDVLEEAKQQGTAWECSAASAVASRTRVVRLATAARRVSWLCGRVEVTTPNSRMALPGGDGHVDFGVITPGWIRAVRATRRGRESRPRGRRPTPRGRPWRWRRLRRRRRVRGRRLCSSRRPP